jgi:hypothetical protein
LRDGTVNPGVQTAAGAREGTDAGAPALVVEHPQSVPLAALPRVPDKAPRDAPTIAVANRDPVTFRSQCRGIDLAQAWPRRACRSPRTDDVLDAAPEDERSALPDLAELAIELATSEAS